MNKTLVVIASVLILLSLITLTVLHLSGALEKGKSLLGHIWRILSWAMLAVALPVLVLGLVKGAPLPGWQRIVLLVMLAIVFLGYVVLAFLNLRGNGERLDNEGRNNLKNFYRNRNGGDKTRSAGGT